MIPCNGNFLDKIKPNLSDNIVRITSFQQAIRSSKNLDYHTRPEVMFTVNQISKYSNKPNKCQWNALKNLLHYLNGTKGKCLDYKWESMKEALNGWADADYANDKKDRKLIAGYVILSFRNPIRWLIKKKLVVAQSTTEAEYIAIKIFSKQLQWLTFSLKKFRSCFTSTIPYSK
ncbi:hypothetical protein O181_120662 [Austropuccinia psidii MF-1]|uniref:Uncharacterized protein n=1 Tax=Austropuccinia psidii MF-1 TaxID=1389203 RepID=A0A9Q3KHF6_9BASI|nr:hypothetical protein [Austropuccinia psidii MF-1]